MVKYKEGTGKERRIQDSIYLLVLIPRKIGFEDSIRNSILNLSSASYYYTMIQDFNTVLLFYC